MRNYLALLSLFPILTPYFLPLHMRDTWSIFDVIGPVMVGPSSSHTAGACKIGYMARIIFGKVPQKVTLKLHGSFGEVYDGHCTDVAIVGGLLGMLPSDPRIKTAYQLAEEAGMEVVLKPVNLGAKHHPNTVVIEMQDEHRPQSVRGASLGGGKTVISEIDKVDVAITGSYSSLLVCFDNTVFDLNALLKFAAERDISIVKMETTQYKTRSILDIEIKEWFERDIIADIEKLEGVHWARFLNHISHYDEGDSED